MFIITIIYVRYSKNYHIRVKFVIDTRRVEFIVGNYPNEDIYIPYRRSSTDLLVPITREYAQYS